MNAYGIHAEAVLNRLYRELADAETRRAAAMEAMIAAVTSGDDDAWDRAAEEHDALADETYDLARRVEELEDRA